MSDVAISAAHARDRDAIVPLLVAQYDEHAIPCDRARLDAAVAAALEDPRALFLVAKRGGAVIGVAYLAFLPSMEHQGDAAWLEELFVAPAHRDGGVGGALLDASIEHARARRCVALELEVEATHARAMNLYRRHGFASLARTRFTKAL